MNSKSIYEYILNIENDNNKLKDHNRGLFDKYKKVTQDIEDLSKVSIIGNFNKQIKEKNILIDKLEKDIRKNKNSKDDVDKEEFNKEKEAFEKDRDVFNKEKEAFNKEKEAFEKERDAFEKERDTINKDEVNKEQKQEKIKKEYKVIKYKNNKYLLDDNNNIFNNDDKELLNIIGTFINNKIKLNK